MTNWVYHSILIIQSPRKADILVDCIDINHEHSRKKFAVIGAGIVGSALSLWLNGQGGKVSLYERRSAKPFLKRPTIQKRNINLALSHRGLKSLSLLELKDQIIPMCCPMYGRRIYPSADEAPFFQPMDFPTKPFILYPDLT